MNDPAAAGAARDRASSLLRDPRFMLPSAKRAAAASLVAIRAGTGGAGMLPSFLIVGAQRCGTTSMVRALGQHPSMFNAILNQEVHFFDDSYGHGLQWYRSHFPLRAYARFAARKAAAPPLAFESSPYYMFHPLAPERIARDLPRVKLLVMLRDPAERAYSAHAHESFVGHETEPFERALELEAERLDGESERIVAVPGYVSRSHHYHAYRLRGQYVDQLERLERLFGRERILVIDSAAFFEDPAPVYEAVLRFLGLPRATLPSFTRYNARPRAPMSERVRAALREHYQPYDERLARWLGHQPSWRA
jgi:Sulfotransferase domain